MESDVEAYFAAESFSPNASSSSVSSKRSKEAVQKYPPRELSAPPQQVLSASTVPQHPWRSIESDTEPSQPKAGVAKQAEAAKWMSRLSSVRGIVMDKLSRASEKMCIETAGPTFALEDFKEEQSKTSNNGDPEGEGLRRRSSKASTKTSADLSVAALALAQSGYEASSKVLAGIAKTAGFHPPPRKQKKYSFGERFAKTTKCSFHAQECLTEAFGRQTCEVSQGTCHTVCTSPFERHLHWRLVRCLCAVHGSFGFTFAAGHEASAHHEDEEGEAR